ncbi:MAG: MBL fold metallo-hydrolase [Bacillaceae bacterium]
MNYVQIPLGPLQTNAYILINNQKECVIFDPGSEGNIVVKYIKEEGLKPLAILLTHAHFDHIGGIDEVREAYSIPVYVHEKEKEWLANPDLNGSRLFMRQELFAKEADEIITGEKKLQIGPFTFTVMETPGHSPGSVSYYCKEAKVVFSGDALFYGSIGRTDLPFGDHDTLIKNIRGKLYSLPDTTTVCCGHGPETAIGFEKKNNPYVKA